MDFRIIGINGKKKFDLDSTTFYEIPTRKAGYRRFTHRHNGKLCFGISKSKIKAKRFIEIPDFLPGSLSVTHVRFPDYKFSHAGHNYGKPVFHGSL